MTTPKLTLSADRTQIVDDHGNLVADVAQYSRDPSFTDRNAFLLASAPALYAALSTLLKMVEDDDWTTVELNEARTALALARGEKGGEVK